MKSYITFYGGAESVTGANFLFECGDTRLLIDCGAHERENICDEINRAPFAYDVSSINALLVTHAHQDHVGLIPKLIHEGFRGVIYSTSATRDISQIMLQDALAIMNVQAESGGCNPLYNQYDLGKVFSMWQTHEYHEFFAIEDCGVEMLDAGHILGSAMYKISLAQDRQSTERRNIVFTGDVGNSPEPLIRDTESLAGSTYIVTESVYGDRLHESREQSVAVLRHVIESARRRGGTLLIPAFSVERSQVILYEIHKFIVSDAMRVIPVYFDAPLADKINGVFAKNVQLLNPKAQQEFISGNPFEFDGLINTSAKHSVDIHDASDPKVIIAGAGMSNGGRIRAHEARYLPDPRATILFVGYQVPGSLGRRIQDGEKNVMINGQNICVRASIFSLTGFSGHADRDAMVNIVYQAQKSLEKVFVVMGEPKASLFLGQRIKDFVGAEVVAPSAGSRVEIEL